MDGSYWLRFNDNSFSLQLTDLHNYVVHGVIKNNVKLERAVVLFNNITQWVQCMILDHHKPQDRAQAIVKFIEIAKVRRKERHVTIFFFNSKKNCVLNERQ